MSPFYDVDCNNNTFLVYKNMPAKLSKKGVVILVIAVFLIIIPGIVATVWLLTRSQVGPDDSGAADCAGTVTGNVGACFCDGVQVDGMVCWDLPNGGCPAGSMPCGSIVCQYDPTRTAGPGCWTGTSCDTRIDEFCPDAPPPADNGCTTAAECFGMDCEYPATTYCNAVACGGNGECECRAPEQQTCNPVCTGVDKIPYCNPPACPAGMNNCGTSREGHSCGTKMEDLYCISACSTCGNPSRNYRYCEPGTTETYTCWETGCSGTGCSDGTSCVNDRCINPSCPTESDCTCPITQTYTCWETGCTGTGCSDGTSCVNDRCVNTECPTESDCTCPTPQTYTCWETGCTGTGCSDGTTCVNNRCVNTDCPTESTCECEEEPYCGDGIVDSGEYCDDGNDINDDECRNDCTACGDGILQSGEECDDGNDIDDDECSNDCEIPDEDWDIDKLGNPICIEGKETYAEISYVISVTNYSDVAAMLDKVIDEMEDKVDSDWIKAGSINPSYGRVVGNTIVWDLDALTGSFAAGQTKTFSYTLVVPSTQFGQYLNTATAYPVVGEPFDVDNREIVTCDSPLPDTGIFDHALAKVGAGLILISLSGAYFMSDQFDNQMFKYVTKIGRVERSRKKFERKMTK